MFEKQEEEIRRIEKKEKLLQEFYDILNDSDCFEDEERKVVLEKLQKLQEFRALLQTTLENNKEIYNNQIKGVEKTLTDREHCLVKADKVFVEFPDLLDYFTSKQVSLTQNLNQITSSLQTS